MGGLTLGEDQHIRTEMIHDLWGSREVISFPQINSVSLAVEADLKSDAIVSLGQESTGKIGQGTKPVHILNLIDITGTYAKAIYRSHRYLHVSMVSG